MHLTWSIAYATASIASFLCSADTAIMTLASQTGTTLFRDLVYTGETNKPLIAGVYIYELTQYKEILCCLLHVHVQYLGVISALHASYYCSIIIH